MSGSLTGQFDGVKTQFGVVRADNFPWLRGPCGVVLVDHCWVVQADFFLGLGHALSHFELLFWFLCTFVYQLD